MEVEATTATRGQKITAHAEARTPRPYQPNTDPFHYLAQHFAKRNTEYHRSKLYHAGQRTRKSKRRQPAHAADTPTHNPLVAAAGPIFSLLNRLDQTAHSTPRPAKLNTHHWQHEMRAFIDQATQAGYTHKTIAAASFALSKLVDDTLSQPRHTHAPSKALLPAHLITQQKEAIFHDLLRACEQDPADHLDLTELLYLCLANIDTTADSVESTSTPHTEGHALTRRDTIEKSQQLFALMKQHRRVSDLTSTASDTTSFKHARHRRRKWCLTLGFILLSLAGEYALYQHNRNQFLHRLQLQHQTNQHILSML